MVAPLFSEISALITGNTLFSSRPFESLVPAAEDDLRPRLFANSDFSDSLGL